MFTVNLCELRICSLPRNNWLLMCQKLTTVLNVMGTRNFKNLRVESKKMSELLLSCYLVDNRVKCLYYVRK